MKKMCEMAALELFMYFPGTLFRTNLAGRTPWSLREQGLLNWAEEEVLQRRTGVFGLKETRYRGEVYEFDAEGHVVACGVDEAPMYRGS